MPGPKKQLWRAIPDGHDDFVAGEEGGQWFVEDAGETEIADAYSAARGDKDVGGLQIAVHDPVGVQVGNSVEQLEENRLDHGRGDRMALGSGVVVDDLE